jgi:hypothetical protein
VTRITPTGHGLRLALLPVLLLIALFAGLPGDAAVAPSHDRTLHVSHAMHHDPVAADSHHLPADCAGSAFFCAMMGLCHPAPTPAALVMPVVSHVNDPVASRVPVRSGRHPAIIIPPPRRLFV